MRGILAEVERRGGMRKSIEDGYVQRRILHSAYAEERRIRSGDKIVVGVNTFAARETAGERGTIALHRADPEAVRRQVARVREVKARRDAARARDALARVAGAARGTANVMPAIVEAVKADCTVGEIAGALRDAWGTYAELVAIAAGPAERVATTRPAGGRLKMLLAKPGLDGHDRGAKVLALALRDAGVEVIYTGLRNSVEQIVNAAVQEDVQVIGLSLLSGAHLGLAEKLMRALRERGMTDVQVIVGGTIPDQDIAPLKALGVSAVFPMGSRLDDVVGWVQGLAAGSTA
jgi:(2R)-ethylmalonyl-CoA mutase